ncbi:hypothetical protein PAGU2196_25030 [Pseudomonas sp. PAGU 2196]|uniref:zonular occludens toxin domain-containing protein n=1 Tax=Pseudomonas sp. PAGU 2196 TaxID=2793997 RepID=UPI001EDD8468|nr:zonular occludens toxin domain-containing protein [Pseudomonas sp. PAGU 2196]GHS81669.1 hypothetical protein PAGU2196_25030 [Pseudomonas sp. PAGU 2196]
MAIHAYVGKPGHGKSYGVVEHVVIPSLKQGRHVVTNIPLVADDLLADFGGKISQLPEDWFEQDDLADILPPGCVAVIDECWRRWPAGVNANHANKTDKVLLAEHRHRVDGKNNSMRVVLITQDLAQISSWVRLLIENTYRIRKMSKRAFKLEVYNGYVTGDSPPKSKLIRTTGGSFKKSVYGYYKSATQSSTGEVGDESAADGRASYLRSFGLWAYLGGGIVCLILGIYFVSNYLSPGDKGKKNVPQAAETSAPRKIEPSISTSWRLVGFVHPSRPDPNYRGMSEALALISDVNGNTRYVSFNHCRYFEDFTEAYCVVDGVKITNWAMRKPNPVVNGLIGVGG